MLTKKGAALGAAGILLSLAGCGGGGGGGSGEASISVSPGRVTLNADTRNNSPRASLVASLSGDLERDAQPYIEHTRNAITDAGFIEDTETRSGRVFINFAVPETLGPGTYRDTVTLKLCYDSACREQVRGSPRQIPVTLTVTGGSAPSPEPALSPDPTLPERSVLSPLSSRRLDHDVLDAEYSRALDAIVMVSGSPSPRLYVYHPATGMERSVALDVIQPGGRGNPLPSVSVSPDGLTANVAFGMHVSHVNLNSGGDPFLPAGSNVALDYRPAADSPSGAPSAPGFFTASDLVSVGPDAAFAFPYFMSTIVRINTRTGDSSRVADDSELRARLQPGGKAIYTSSMGLNPTSLGRYSTVVSPDFWPMRHRRLPFEERTCDNLWLSANGRRIYTACGQIFRTSEYPSQDMSALGRLPIDDDVPLVVGVATLADLQDSAEAGQIAAIQGPRLSNGFARYCRETEGTDCRSQLHLYDSSTAQVTASYAITDSDSGPQLAGHVFYSQDGSRKYLIALSYRDSSYRVLTLQ